MTRFIPQMEPLISDADIQAVDTYMRSGAWLTEFEQTRLFEQGVARFTGARFCCAAPNGTLALFLALAASGIGPGDEVIVPDLTMAATATSVVLAGGTVVFADIEARSLCLDLDKAEALISARTKAIIVVSLNGRAPDGLSAFIERCRRREICVIEDAAQSLGSYAGGAHLGTLGDVGCFSFSSQKLVTTGQGGAVVTNDAALHERMRLLRDFGRTEGGSDHYLRVGWNLKLTDLQAVIGVEQMRRLPSLVERKRELYGWYCDGLAGVRDLELPATDRANVTPWFVDVLVEPAAKAPLAACLRDAGIGTRPFYPALHAEPAFDSPGSFPVAEAVSRRGLWLPSSLRLRHGDVDRVCAAVRQFFA